MTDCFLAHSLFQQLLLCMAQIFLGAGAIKQKKRNPPVLVINGRQYKLNGWVLGAIVYYNCAVIYVIIAVSISFFIVKYLGHLKHANQVLHDCCYLNDSNLGVEPIHIETVHLMNLKIMM